MNVQRQITARRDRGFKHIFKYWQLYLMLLPSLAYIGIFNYGPMYGVQIAFKNFSTSLGINGSEWIGLKNFVRFINYTGFSQIMKNTVFLSLYNIGVGFPLPVLLALMMNEIRHTGYKKTAQMMTYLPYFVSAVVECGLVVIFLDQTSGIINHIIAALGGERKSFITSAKWFKTIFVFSDVWKTCGWNTIIYMVALSGVSQECIESAKVDGASRFRIVTNIKLPHIMPTVIIQLILRTGRILSVGHEKILLLINDLNSSSANIISYYTYRVGLQAGEFSYSSAIGLFNNFANILMLLIVNYIASKVSETSLF